MLESIPAERRLTPELHGAVLSRCLASCTPRIVDVRSTCFAQRLNFDLPSELLHLASFTWQPQMFRLAKGYTQASVLPYQLST